MKAQQIKAALTKARARLAATEKAAKSALILAESLKKNLRDAKRAYKESRRTYKQVRKFFKTAASEQADAEKSFKKAFARLTRLEAKAQNEAKKKAPIAASEKSQKSPPKPKQTHAVPRPRVTSPVGFTPPLAPIPAFQ
jgi:hypothetical protein